MRVAYTRRVMRSRLLGCFLLAGILLAQNAAQVREKLGKIGVFNDVTVILPDGTEYYGAVRRIGEEDFTINEVDRKQVITLRFDAVKSVRAGYRGRNFVTGKRVHLRRSRIVTLAVIGGLLLLVFVAVAHDK